MYDVPWLFNVLMNTVMKEVELPDLLYADDLVLFIESEEDKRAMVGCFFKGCRRGGLKVNGGKRKVMVLNGEEGLEFEVCVDRIGVYVGI